MFYNFMLSMPTFRTYCVLHSIAVRNSPHRLEWAPVVRSCTVNDGPDLALGPLQLKYKKWTTSWCPKLYLFFRAQAETSVCHTWKKVEDWTFLRISENSCSSWTETTLTRSKSRIAVSSFIGFMYPAPCTWSLSLRCREMSHPCSVGAQRGGRAYIRICVLSWSFKH